jgi:hypothetical protein
VRHFVSVKKLSNEKVCTLFVSPQAQDSKSEVMEGEYVKFEDKIIVRLISNANIFEVNY